MKMRDIFFEIKDWSAGEFFKTKATRGPIMGDLIFKISIEFLSHAEITGEFTLHARYSLSFTG